MAPQVGFESRKSLRRQPTRTPPFQTIGPPLFEKLAQITTVVAVLQDWDAPREAFLRRVHGLGAAVRAVIVREGSTTLPSEHAGAELGEVGLMTPADVERALSGPGQMRPSPTNSSESQR